MAFLLLRLIVFTNRNTSTEHRESNTETRKTNLIATQFLGACNVLVVRYPLLVCHKSVALYRRKRTERAF
ncbi:uncharacterized protein Dere_GG26873 [Drosophila erecta]|uniref:Uncharacterized protein n=1 Tax=Drosophila erecta TaxID=7220 RepID=A0A0Q5U3Q8_DROER|nr:uncharacterized protein Dere_GG26873 [Drosophila erecta]